jgi:hypothetical protein
LISIPESSDAPSASNRLVLLHPERLGAFRMGGDFWLTPAHYWLGRTLARREDREKVGFADP